MGNIDKPKLAVLVPFRDRFDELLKFAPYLTNFLRHQGIPHHIFILNQADRFRFNRASLINTGFLYTEKEFDYIAMHDVDLLPLNDNLNYSFPVQGVFHVAAPNLHPKYNYDTFVGGILLVNKKHFREVNGMSNRYWGWGLEDDEFYTRLTEAKIPVMRPPSNIGTDKTNTFSHIHDRLHRKRDTIKCYNQREVTRKRDRVTGLNNSLKYEIADRKILTIDEDTTITVLNIQLHCDKSLTPWCECEGAPTQEPNKKSSKTKSKV